MKALFLIPARGGSKGVPGKNIKELNMKRLISYSIDQVRAVTSDENICVSTDDDEIIDVVQNEYDLKVPFKRPDSLANDNSGMYGVLEHAVNYYEELGRTYDFLVLLQPTSPFRKVQHIREAIARYSNDIDLVLSVFITPSNPYYLLFEEDDNGYLQKSKKGVFERRQDLPEVYEINGAIYVININTLKNSPIKSLSEFPKIVKYVMPAECSIDIDTPLDWAIAEYLTQKGIV